MKTILVIEDNLEVRENVSEILHFAGYAVNTAHNGKVGIEKIREHLPDLIICDVMMPELDGFGVLNILHRKPETFSIPFIFLTAMGDQKEVRKGMRLGADDYLVKPFERIDLLEAVETRLDKVEKIKKGLDGPPGGLRNFYSPARGLKQLDQLAADRETKFYVEREFIYREGEYPRRLYLILNGKVKITKTNELGKELITQVLDAGSSFGHFALLKDVPYQQSAAALTDAHICFIPKKDFLALLYNNCDFSSHFIDMLAQNTFEQEDHLLQLAFNSLRKRVAETLLLMENHLKKAEAKHFTLYREDLANFVGTARESVSRILTDLKNEGLISLEGRRITVLDRKKLENLPN